MATEKTTSRQAVDDGGRSAAGFTFCCAQSR
jgi:hypothetical protein